MRETEGRVMCLLALMMEEGHESRKAGCLRRRKGQGKKDSPLLTVEGTTP
jgi:hypothetical protein